MVEDWWEDKTWLNQIPLSITATAPGAETVTMTYGSPPVVASP